MASVRQDKVQVVLEVQGSAARTELDNLGRKSNVLAAELRNCKKGTQEYIDKNKELSQVSKRMSELQNELGLTSLSLKQLGTLSRTLNSEIAGLVPGTEEFTQKSARLIEVQNRFRQVQVAAAGVHDATDKAGGGLLDFVKKGAALGGLALGAEAVVSGVLGQGQAIFDTTAKFEKYFAVLENNLGDKNLAAESMALIADLAASTPFSVDQLTGSFIKFVNRGIIPSKKELTQLGDLAASQGKDFDQLTEAILDATSGGGFERLKEFGVQASKNGDIVSLAFKGIKKEVANTPEAIAAAIQGFGAMKGVAGGMAAIAGTLEGQVSNLGDTADQLRVQIGNGLRPVFVAILSTMGTFLGILKETPAFIRNNADLLGILGLAILAMNTKQIALTATTLAANAAERARAIATTATAVAQRVLNAAMTANPIGLVITAVALLVAGFVRLYNSSAQVREAVAGIAAASLTAFKLIKDSAVTMLSGVADLLVGLFTFDRAKIQAGLAQLGTALFENQGAKVSEAYHRGHAAQEAKENAAAEKRNEKVAERKKAKAKVDAEALAEVERKARLEAAKNEESALKLKLAKVAEGSAAELALKKRLVENAALQDTLGEKKSAAEVARIRQESAAEVIKLDAEYRKKRIEAAGKEAKEKERLAKESGEIEAKIEDLKIAGIADETERKIAALKVAAAREIQLAKGTADQIARQKQLIEERLQVQLAELTTTAEAKELADAQRQADKLIAIEQKQALATAKLRVTAAVDGNDPEAELAARIALAREQANQEMLAEGLSYEERLLIYENFLNEKQALTDASREAEAEKDRSKVAAGLEAASQGIALIGDFQRIASDKDLAKVEKDKNSRLKKLEAEYKSGKKSKEVYESEKNAIESQADEKTRALKTKAAKDEKKLNIAQAVIAGTLAVLKAAPNIPMMALAGILAAASVVKIIATPIPEFAAGGIIGGGRTLAKSASSAWRGVKKYANGGINKTAGVADVGQRHSGGGIQMIDGATGQHLGEWERGEPYMILSRQTYANNREMVDALLDTSMNHNGAPVRQRGGFYADGGITGGAAPAGAGGAAGGAGEAFGAMIAAQQATTAAVLALPNRVRAVVDREAIADIGDELAEQDAIRQENRA
jgi:hypothetical protein